MEYFREIIYIIKRWSHFVFKLKYCKEIYIYLNAAVISFSIILCQSSQSNHISCTKKLQCIQYIFVNLLIYLAQKSCSIFSLFFKSIHISCTKKLQYLLSIFCQLNNISCTKKLQYIQYIFKIDSYILHKKAAVFIHYILSIE